MVVCCTAKELQFQSPPTCPANHVPRVELLKEISSAVLNSDITPTIGTTVTIRGIGGIGKSTIAKAVCHDHLIQEHFVNGFLWISLTPPLPNPMTMLSEIYQRLTGKCATLSVSISVLKSDIKSLISNHSCKLLVILDDVWEAKDAMMFVDVFSSCKLILTTRKMNINTKIPPKISFDIKSMTIDEAVKLLQLQIIKQETLHTTDISRIEELARDLHCWPLLLNLVHGQLYVRCVEWNESPQDAILKVQQKLLDKGLTAFDPEDELQASRENAVRASITASLELLTKNDKIVLFYIASSIVGFGVYTFKDMLCKILKGDIKQFDNHIRNLWCHGLISLQDMTFPHVVTKIPCIGIHEVIAQFINENMPDIFYLNITVKVTEVYKNVYLSQCFSVNAATNVGQLFLSHVNGIFIPFWIRFSIFHVKVVQIILNKNVNHLIGQNIPLLQNKSFFHNIQVPPLKHMHKIIKEDCRIIQSILADGKCSEAISWAKQYFDNHVFKLTFEKILSNLITLLNLCKSYAERLPVEDCISCINRGYNSLDEMRNVTILLITGYYHVFYLVNVAASDDDVKHYLKCAKLYINKGS